MSSSNRNIAHNSDASTVLDVLERLLDKGIVIAGDIRVKVVEVELLTIQLRLVIASVDKAKELGLDWWNWDNTFADPAIGKDIQSAADGDAADAS